MGTSYSPPPTAGNSNSALTDGERADCLVKLMSHVRLHLLYLAEKLQERLVASEGATATAASIEQTKHQVMDAAPRFCCGPNQ